MSKLKKAVEEMHERKSTELDVHDKGIVHFQDVPGICKCQLDLYRGPGPSIAEYQELKIVLKSLYVLHM